MYHRRAHAAPLLSRFRKVKNGMTADAAPRTIAWVGDTGGHVRLIDQTLLPTELTYRDCRTVEEIWEAIRSLRVRGAPAIGIAAAMGVVLGVRPARDLPGDRYADRLREVTDYL